jgi:hypothetical protein
VKTTKALRQIKRDKTRTVKYNKLLNRVTHLPRKEVKIYDPGKATKRMMIVAFIVLAIFYGLGIWILTRI